MASPTIEWNSSAKTYGVVNFNNDSDMVVHFYQKSILDKIASTERGMPIYKDAVYVKMFRPGEQLNIVDRPMHQADAQRFPNQYQNYLAGKVQVPEGTPIDLLFPNNPSIADNLRTRGIYTVQQCAHLTAHAIDTIGMGAQEYVNRAKKYIESATSGESFIKYQEEMKAKDQEIKLLKTQLDTMRQQIDMLIAKASAPDKINPVSNTMEAPFIEGFDVQSARIEANHVTHQLKTKK